jgi:membrane protein required for colicin V production
MNYFDFFVLASLILSTFSGFFTGFILQVASMLGALAALAVAKLEYADVRQMLLHVAPHSPWLTAFTYVGIFLVVWAAIILIARRLRGLVRRLKLGAVDRLGGAALGFLQGAVVVELVIYLSKRVQSGGLAAQVRHSVLAGAFEQIVPFLQGWFPHVSG